MIHKTSPAERRKQVKRARRTEHFLDAALRVLDAEGLDGLTISRVAQEAESAVGAMYRYFAGKDELLAALQVRAVTRFGTLIDQAVEGSAPALDKVRRAAHAWPCFATVEPALYRLLDASFSDPSPGLPDEHALAVDHALAPVLARVAACLAEAVDEGALAPGDPALRTQVLWAVVHGAAHFRKRERLGGPTVEVVLEAAVEALMLGWSRA